MKFGVDDVEVGDSDVPLILVGECDGMDGPAFSGDAGLVLGLV